MVWLLDLLDFKGRRRRRVAARPFPPEWRAAIERHVPYWQRLTDDERRELERHVQVFLSEKRFEGCAGLTITDEMRVVIAAQACLLLLNRETSYFPRLGTILVYPRRYFADAKVRQPDGVVVEGVQGRLGESWSHGSLVLSWEDVQRGSRWPHDGRNVVLHEFAHQLDAEWGVTEGAPALPHSGMYGPWSRVFAREYEALHRALQAGWRPPVLDPYGATSPAEFFAVATEAFFERPRDLRLHHPDLYEQLMAYYRQDPLLRQPLDPDAGLPAVAVLDLPQLGLGTWGEFFLNLESAKKHEGHEA